MSDSAAVDLDCRGLLCPQPVIDLARLMREIPEGTTVTVAASDPAARYDIPAWCRMRGQDYLGEHLAEDGTPCYDVRRVS